MRSKKPALPSFDRFGPSPEGDCLGSAGLQHLDDDLDEIASLLLGSARLMEDMDRWGYSFRLGSTRAWFEQDADDARVWLVENGLLDASGAPTWEMRS